MKPAYLLNNEYVVLKPVNNSSYFSYIWL